MKYKGKYDILIESAITRFEMGGLLSGDIVKFRKDTLKNPKIVPLTDQYKQMIEAAMNGDLNLRVSSIKSIRPTTTMNYEGGHNSGTDAPTDQYVDLVVEYAPGLWRDPITVPIEVLERVDTGINLAPVPDSVKRKGKNTKPKGVKSPDSDRKTPDSNTKPSITGKTVDGRTQITKPKEVKKKNQGKLTLEDVYTEMYRIQEQDDYTSYDASQSNSQGSTGTSGTTGTTGTSQGKMGGYRVKFSEPYGKNPDDIVKKIQTMPKLSNNMSAKFVDDNTLEIDAETDIDPDEFKNMVSNVVNGSVEVERKEDNGMTSFNANSPKPAVVSSTSSSLPAA